MANRFPLIIDGNQIKEIPDGDDLYLRNSNISEVKNITSLGIIEAAAFTVQGQTIQARNFSDLADVPASYAGSEKYIVRVKEDGTGLEFVDFQNLGEINFDTIAAGTITGDFIGSVFADDSTVMINALDNTATIGNLKFENSRIENVSGELELISSNGIAISAGGNIWISAGTKLIFEGTIPDEFEAKLQVETVTADRDIFLPDEDGTLATREWINLQQFDTDLTGSVFAVNDTLLVDGDNALIVGNLSGSVVSRPGGEILLDTQNNISYTDVRSLDGNNTLLVDAANGVIPWSVITGAPEFTTTTLDEINVPLDSDFFINVENSSTGASFIRITSSGELEILNSIRAATPNGDLELLTNGTGSIRVHDGQNGLTVDASSGEVSLNSTGTILITGSPIIIGSGTSGSITIGSGSNVVNFLDGTTLDFTGTTILGNTVSYTETDTLTSVTNRGATTVNAINVGGITTSSITLNDPGAVNGDILIYNSSTGVMDPTALADSTILDDALNTSTAVAGDVLSWDGSAYSWVAEGGSSINLTDLIDVDTTGAANGSILKYNGTSWVVGTDETTANPFDQTLDTTDDVIFNSVSTNTLTITGTGTSTIQSGNDIVLSATNRTRVEGTPFRVAQLTTTERNAILSPQNGDIIYNTSDSKFQVRQANIWENLSLQSDVAVPAVSVYDFEDSSSGSIPINELIKDQLNNIIAVSITVTSYTRAEITLSGMLYFGGAPAVNDRKIDIMRSINGGTAQAVTTSVINSSGPSHVVYIDTHGASTGDVVEYTFKNTSGTTPLSIDYSKTNQAILKEL